MQALLAAIRLAPDDVDAALVLGDARLQVQDPWGGLLVAAGRGQAESWLRANDDVVRARWGRRPLGFVRGLVTHVVCGVDLPSPAAVAQEPVATLVVQVPRGDDMPGVLDQLDRWEGAPFGLSLAGAITAAEFARLEGILPRLELVSLDLTALRGGPLTVAVPGLRCLATSGVPRAQPSVERLSVRGDASALDLGAWPALRTLDLRGPLPQRLQEQLPEWLEQGGELVHESRSLEERGRFAPLMSGRPLAWPPVAAPDVVVAMHGGEATIAIGCRVRQYVEDAPLWQDDLPADARSVCAGPRGRYLLVEGGGVRQFTGAPPRDPLDATSTRAIASAPAALAVHAVPTGARTTRVGWASHEVTGVRVGSRFIPVAATAVAISPRGDRLAAVGVDGVVRVFDLGNGALAWAHPLGSPLLAVVGIPGGWCVASRTEVWRLGGASPVFVDSGPGRDRPLLAASGSWLAWSVDPAVVHARQLDGPGTRSTRWPASFSGNDSPLQVEALAVEGDQLLVALSGGAANAFDCASGEARKLDEHRGQAARRWVFMHDGRFLVAG